MNNFKTFSRWFLLAVMLSLSSGCATTPRVSDIIHDLPAGDETPQILERNRFLTPRQSKTLLERLKRSADPSDLLERQISVIESVSGSPLVKGNKVTLLNGGPETCEAMFRAVENAKDHIHIETFIFKDDETGRKLAELLLKKQSEGVQVSIIYDSAGSFSTSSAFFEQLREGGIQVLEFSPLNPFRVREGWHPAHRDHRKILIVDGRLVITGGVNISHVYLEGTPESEGEDEKRIPWRDTDIQLEGPAVAEYQKVFLETWKKQNGPQLAERSFFPPLKEQGTDLVQVVNSTPGDRNRTTFIMYVSAITFAEKSIHMTNAYFVPDDQIVLGLSDTASRGVDVKIILPGKSDFTLALYAGQYYYSDLLKAGVRLYERRNAILHAKTAVIDSVWSTVGSTNMDFWSFLSNDEINAVILSRPFADKMEKMFSADLEKSEEITLEEWQKRPLLPRLREWFSHLFMHWL